MGDQTFGEAIEDVNQCKQGFILGINKGASSAWNRAVQAVRHKGQVGKWAVGQVSRAVKIKESWQ